MTKKERRLVLEFFEELEAKEYAEESQAESTEVSEFACSFFAMSFIVTFSAALLICVYGVVSPWEGVGGLLFGMIAAVFIFQFIQGIRDKGYLK
jgi:F0F1-type ATP synthase assembly protein I